MAKTRLLILNDNDFNSGYGGQASFIKNLHPYLDKKYELTYLILPKFVFKQRIIPFRFIYLIRVFLFLLGKGEKFDIILSHTPEASFASSFFSIPFIHIFHGNTNVLEKSVFWYGKYFKWVFNYFEKRIVRKASLLYTVGDFRPDAKKFYNPISLRTVSIDTKVNGKKDFVFAGRLEELKNVNAIINIYNLLPTSIKEKHLLHIIGTGTQETYLKKMVHKLRLEDKIIFHGLVKNEIAIQFINQSSILLMASLFEGFPMVIAESLSVGTPIISTDVGDIRSIVKNEYNGYLLPLNFALEEYVDKIKKLLNNYEFFSKNAVKSSEVFDAEKIALSFILDVEGLSSRA